MSDKPSKMLSPTSGGVGGPCFTSTTEEEPRLPPRLSRFPAPFDFPEKPVCQVPDVSLIDSSLTLTPKTRNHPCSSSFSPSFGLGTLFPSPSLPNNTPGQAGLGPGSSAPPPNYNVDGIVQELAAQRQLLSGLQTKLDRVIGMESKLDNLIQFQDEFLAKLFQKGTLLSKEVQTEGTATEMSTTQQGRNGAGHSSAPRRSPPTSMSDSGGGGSSTPSRTSTPASGQKRRVTPSNMIPSQMPGWNHRGGRGGPLARVLHQEAKDSSRQDSLSPLQLPSMTLNEPSALYSEASGIKSLQLQEFHDDSFNSGSGTDSPVLGSYPSDSSTSSDDEEDVASPVIKITKPGGLPAVHKLASNGRQHVSGSSSSSGSSGKENRGREVCPQSSKVKGGGDEVVLKTKQYLETLGVRFNTPTPGKEPTPNRNNYMIQQNVYNSIYIPTVNCAPVVAETFPGSGSGSNFHSLAQKYANPDELREFDAMRSNGNHPGTETTLYGMMTASNLSFATKDYLQRYGLVTQPQPSSTPSAPPPSQPQHNPDQPRPRHRHHRSKPPPVSANREKDRILNMTAIKNQPKLI